MYHILIADADVDAWFQVNALLRRYLVKANFVSSLALAKQHIEKDAPSILFVDKQLLDKSFKDFIGYVKLKCPFVKIIMINGIGKTAKRLQSSADLVICRPIIPEIIERALLKMAYPQLQPVTV